MEANETKSTLTISEIERLLAAAVFDRASSLEDHSKISPWELKLVRRFKSRHSEFLEYQSIPYNHQPPIIVKRIIEGRSPSAASECVVREYNAIATLKNKMIAGQRPILPVPVAIFPQAKALAMEELRGKPLDGILKRKANCLGGILWRARAREIGSKVARWLLGFQYATRQPMARHDSALYLGSLTTLLDRCTQMGFRSDSAKEIRKMATNASRIVHGNAATAAARHGDFIPQNILVDGDHIALVDFENYRERDLIYEDIGTFLAYLRLQAGSPLYSKISLGAMAEGFIGCYGNDASPKLLSLYTLKAAVQNASEFRAGVGIRSRIRASFMWSQLVSLSHELLKGL